MTDLSSKNATIMDCSHAAASNLSVEYGTEAIEEVSIATSPSNDLFTQQLIGDDIESIASTATPLPPSTSTESEQPQQQDQQQPSENSISQQPEDSISQQDSPTHRKSILEVIAAQYRRRQHAGEPEPRGVNIGCILCLLCVAAVPLLALGLYDEETAKHAQHAHDDDFMRFLDDGFESSGLKVTDGLSGSNLHL
ncbi:hypothetical protein MPSEU_000030800 [Mayamaea pseudoterrestris]|nr:hypothetical protein MPSEU_000030800 [Mayamaea pseudoterrestris]